MPSSVSLVANGYRAMAGLEPDTRSPEWRAIADATIEYYRRLLRFEREFPEEQWITVRFDELVRDPLPTVERIYAHLGLPMSAEAARTIGEEAAASARHRSRGHSYSLEEFGLTSYLNRLVCEVTERQALTDIGRAALETSRQHHIRVAMDDFGTGYSGLGQLLGMSFDVLKIDASQVKHLMKDPTADRLVRGIVALANVLRAKIVAEGVETAAQAFFLHAAGVDYGQGWFWSKALPPAELPRVLDGGFSHRNQDLLALLHDTGKASNP